jgi:hypothetical protein
MIGFPRALPSLPDAAKMHMGFHFCVHSGQSAAGRRARIL